MGAYQVITEFCSYTGTTREIRQVIERDVLDGISHVCWQGLIKLAKNNGNTLGFLS